MALDFASGMRIPDGECAAMSHCEDTGAIMREAGPGDRQVGLFPIVLFWVVKASAFSLEFEKLFARDRIPNGNRAVPAAAEKPFAIGGESKNRDVGQRASQNMKLASGFDIPDPNQMIGSARGGKITQWRKGGGVDPGDVSPD